MSISTFAAAAALACSLAFATQTSTPPRTASPTPRVAPQAKPGEQGFQLDPPPTKNPYGKLFDPSVGTRPGFDMSPPQRKTICGLAVWNVTPEADPRMVLRHRSDAVDHKIRRIAPPVCAD